MREILFRGKNKVDGEWSIGSLTHDTKYGNCFIEVCVHQGICEEVIPETVGQYTGLTDKRGKKIFEGDIIKYRHHDINEKAVIRYGAPENRYTMYGWYLDDNQGNTAFRLSEYFIKDYNCQVIGNIYDNPEFLKGSIENE